MKITITHQHTFEVSDLKEVIPSMKSESRQELFNQSDPPTTPIVMTRVESRVKNYHTFKGHAVKVSKVKGPRPNSWILVESDSDLFKYSFEDLKTRETIRALESPDCLTIREYKERTPEFTFPFKVRENDKPTPILIQNLSQQYVYNNKKGEFTRVKATPVNYICVAPLDIQSYTRRNVANYLRMFGVAFKQARLLGAQCVHIPKWGQDNGMTTLIQIVCARATRINLVIDADVSRIKICRREAKRLLPEGDSVRFDELVDNIISLRDTILMYNAKRQN